MILGCLLVVTDNNKKQEFFKEKLGASMGTNMKGSINTTFKS